LRYHFLTVCEKVNWYNVLRGIGVGEQLQALSGPSILELPMLRIVGWALQHLSAALQHDAHNRDWSAWFQDFRQRNVS
jgi:hypothetical protein